MRRNTGVVVLVEHVDRGGGSARIPQLVENQRRSIAMLPPGAPALNRDEALEILGQLVEALREVRRCRGG